MFFWLCHVLLIVYVPWSFATGICTSEETAPSPSLYRMDLTRKYLHPVSIARDSGCLSLAALGTQSFPPETHNLLFSLIFNNIHSTSTLWQKLDPPSAQVGGMLHAFASLLREKPQLPAFFQSHIDSHARCSFLMHLDYSSFCGSVWEQKPVPWEAHWNVKNVGATLCSLLPSGGEISVLHLLQSS